MEGGPENSMPSESLWNELIDELAQRCGIEAEYTDNAGQVHVTSRETKQLLLQAMGLKLDSLAELQQAVADRRQRPWNRLLEPVVVWFQSAGPPLCNLYLPLPEGQLPGHLAIHWQLEDEADQVEQGQIQGPELKLIETRLVEGQNYGRLELPLPGNLALGYYELRVEVRTLDQNLTGRTRLIMAPDQAYVPPALAAGGRTWGLIFPLYALRREHGWGVGDFGDLLAMVDWAGSELQAGLIGLNPFNTLTNRYPEDVSPYSPSSRLFWSMIYLDLEAIPELADCPAAQALLAQPSFQAERERLNQADQVDYASVFNLKRRFLKLLFDTFGERHGLPEQPRTARGQALASYIAQEGQPLQTLALFQSLADHWQQQGHNFYSWSEWPPEYQHPDHAAVQAFARRHPREILFYQYVQWLVEEQLQRVVKRADDLALPVGLYPDLALGVYPGGHDTWSYQDQFALPMEIGAPPDAFNPQGQNWQLPPLIPERLRETGYQLFIDTLQKSCRPAGALRVDHVMGLFRLFWIPQGKSPAAGAYVRYNWEELLGVLALESVRHQTLIIGEDLGTVPGYIRETLAREQIFSYRLFYFERTANGRFCAPEDYPALALASTTTHDLPTLAGYWTGRDIEVRERLGLYSHPDLADQDRQERQLDKGRILELLATHNLLPPGCPREPQALPELSDDLRWAILSLLAQTPCRLLALNLEDVFGGLDQQNFPGTIHEYPNWRLKMPWSVEQMRRSPQARRLAALMADQRPRPAVHKPTERITMANVPIIYNLFPLLAGPIRRWADHLDRIAAMGFNWIFVNPFHYPGFSGSLYAIKDYFGFHPLLVGEDQDPEASLQNFVDQAGQRGLSVMMDLVINHTAVDSPIVDQHPEWFAKNPDGSIKNPSCIDPADDTKVTVWGDLAEINYWPPPDPEGLLAFWETVLKKYIDLGFKGFRGDAAYKIPGSFWAKLIAAARAINPEVCFVAETLGCRLEEMAQLREAGFDYLCNSSKWWDFQADWCLEQYESNRRIAPSISFPETHDTPRLAAEARGAVEIVRQRYLFAAFFSAGLMLPMGYEYGFRKRLNVVKTRPQDWEEPRFDLTNFIRAVNQLKQSCPIMLEEGPIKRLTPAPAPVVMLLKSSDTYTGQVLAVINTKRRARRLVLPDWEAVMGVPANAIVDLTPETVPLPLEALRQITLEPAEIRLFYAPGNEKQKT